MAEAAPVQTAEFSPLQAPLVLKTIFEGSSLSDVKEFRKVSKSWNVESSKMLKESAQLEIGTYKRKGPVLTLDKFMNLVDNEMCVFTRKDSFPESVLLVGAENDSRFWRRFGCHIKTLKLREATFPTPDDFREAIFDSCPNLKKLEMTEIQLLGVDGSWTKFPDYDFPSEEEKSTVNEDDSDSTDCTKPGHKVVNENLKFLELCDFHKERFPFSLFKRVFNHFPNLEALHVTSGNVDSQNDAIFAAFNDWLEGGDGRDEKLKEIGLDFSGLNDPDETAELLATGKLRLETLELLDYQEDNDIDAAQALLEGHEDTLKKLTLRGYAYFDDWDPVFPLSNGLELKEVEELVLDVGRLESTEAWKCVPNLKKLVLLDKSLINVVSAVSVSDLRNVALTNCVEVVLVISRNYMDEGYDQAEITRKLTALLPNVQKLTLTLQDFTTGIFAILCESFPKLVELIVSTKRGERSLDSVITGLDRELVKKINREGKNGDWQPEGEPIAGLAKLKELKVLSIRCYKGLGYSSAVAGIQRLPQLEQLQLDFEKVDEEVWNGVWKPLLDQFPWRGN